MLDTYLISALLLLQTVVSFSLLAGLAYFVLLIRRSRVVRILTIMDELLDRLLENEGGPTQTRGVVSLTDEAAPSAPPGQEARSATDTDTGTPSRQYRDRLASLVAGGQAKQYLGRTLTVEQIETMSDVEIERLYSRYQSRLGAAMTKTLGVSLVKLYCSAASTWLPIDDKEELESDLQSDPFVEHALSGLCCQLYHRFGTFLAPVTAALTTAKHCVRQLPGPEIDTECCNDDDVGGGDFAVGTATSRGTKCHGHESDTTRSVGRDPAEGPQKG